jgi:opacity protein-like surface antigen
MRSAVIACAFVLAAAGAAQAQTSDRGSVYVRGGVTFGTETSSVVAGGAAFTVTPGIQVFGEVGRMQNVMPKSLKEDLDTITSMVTAYYGVPITLDVNVPAIYGLGGVRLVVPVSGRVHPYVEGGLGVASLSADIKAEVMGINISQEVEDEADLSNETKLMIAVGGGISADLTRSLQLDAGYRFTHINTDDPAVNTSALYGGLRFVF